MCDEVRREVQRCDPLCLHPDALKAARLMRPSDLIEIHSHTQPRQEPGYMKFLLQAAASAAAGYKSIIHAKEDFHWILQTLSNEVEVGDCYKMPLLEPVRHEGRRTLEQVLQSGAGRLARMLYRGGYSSRRTSCGSTIAMLLLKIGSMVGAVCSLETRELRKPSDILNWCYQQNDSLIDEAMLLKYMKIFG